MDHLPDILPHVRYMPSGQVVVVSIVAAFAFVVYKVIIPLETSKDYC
jgi:hypothetical protein